MGEETLKEMLKTYDNNNEIKKSVDEAQTRFRCCGVNSAKDWTTLLYKTENLKVPKSCCKEDIDCENDPNMENAYLDGCYTPTKNFVIENAQILGGIGISMGILLAVVGVITLIFKSCIREFKLVPE